MSRSATPQAVQVPRVDASRYLARVKQVQWDHYYMAVARTVTTRSNCFGALVGAVLVADNRIISTGFNGTPAGFANCRDGGCARCRERELARQGLWDQITEPDIASGPKHLDVCICVHAEANAFLSAARTGTRTDGSVLYVTSKPCFDCLKEACQAGVKRIVWLEDWIPTDSPLLAAQYTALVEYLSDSNPRNFEQLGRQSDIVPGGDVTPREPVLDEFIHSSGQAVPDGAEKGATRSRSNKEAVKSKR